YAWARSPLGNLQSPRMSDVPVATQRSDEWPLEWIPGGEVEGKLPVKLDRRQRRELQQALRKQDLERRLQEAKSLIEAQAK
ncbi:MAG: hypothetical protein AAF517_26415, partial [Planctomycetota bacterium]